MRFLGRLRVVSLSALLLLSVLGLSFSPFLSSSVYASSVWDGLVQTTPTAVLEGTGCTIDVPWEGLVVDLIQNDSLDWSTPSGLSGDRENIQALWDSKTAFQAVQMNTYTGAGARDIRVFFKLRVTITAVIPNRNNVGVYKYANSPTTSPITPIR